MHLCMLFATLGGVCYGEVSVHTPNSNTTAAFDSLQARFGPNLPAGGFVGLLHPTTPLVACENVTAVPEPNTTYVALIERGGDHCEFGTKVFNAQQAGYAAAIIFDNMADAPLRPMDSNLNGIKIPSVFVSKAAGKYMLAAPPGTTATLYRDENPQWPAFVIISIAVSLTVICMICVFVYTRRRSRNARYGVGACSTLSKAEFSRLQTRTFGAINDDHDACCICLEEYKPGASLVALPCNHAFHKKCIAPWLMTRRRTCPICKRDPFPNEHSPLLSETA